LAIIVFHINVRIGAADLVIGPSEDGRGLVKIPQIGNVLVGKPMLNWAPIPVLTEEKF